MSFRIRGLSPELFSPFFAMSDAALREIGAIRSVVEGPGLPCRVSLKHAVLGDEILLLNYEHLPARSPYRARHAIYVARGSRLAGRPGGVIAGELRALPTRR